MEEIRISHHLQQVVQNYVDRYFPADNDPHPNNLFTCSNKDFIGLMGEVVVAECSVVPPDCVVVFVDKADQAELIERLNSRVSKIEGDE